MFQYFSARTDIDIDGINGADLLEKALQWSTRVMYYLPKNTDLDELYEMLQMANDSIRIFWSENHDSHSSNEPSAILMYLGMKGRPKALLVDIKL